MKTLIALLFVVAAHADNIHFEDYSCVARKSKAIDALTGKRVYQIAKALDRTMGIGNPFATQADCQAALDAAKTNKNHIVCTPATGKLYGFYDLADGTRKGPMSEDFNDCKSQAAGSTAHYLCLHDDPGQYAIQDLDQDRQTGSGKGTLKDCAVKITELESQRAGGHPQAADASGNAGH